METVLRFLRKLADEGIALSADGDQLNFNDPQNFMSDDVRKELDDFTPEIFGLFKEFPLSSGARRLYSLQKRHPEMGAFNVPMCFKLASEIDIELLGKSWACVLDQYPILKSRIIDRQNGFYHFLDESCRTVIQQQAITFEDEKQEFLFLQEQAKKPFDVNQGPLTRIDLFTRTGGDSILMVTVHSVIFDAKSASILMKSLFNFYQKLVRGDAVEVTPELFCGPLFSHREEVLLTSTELSAHINYWQNQLGGELPSIQLLPDLPRLIAPDVNRKIQIKNISSDLFYRLRDLSNSESLGMSTLFLSLFQILLRRYANQEDIIIGMPVDNRAALKSPDSVGCFTNVIPLRIRCDERLTLSDYCREVDAIVKSSQEHAGYPLVRMLDMLGFDKTEKNPVFQITYAFINSEQQANTVSGVEVIAKFIQGFDVDLGIEIIESQDSVTVLATYNPELYSPEVITIFLERYSVLLKAVSDSPQRLVHEYPIISAEEKHQLLIDFNNTQADYSNDKCLHQLFIEHVNNNPNKIAVIDGDEQLTYQQLFDKSHTLALYLQSLGVQPDSLIGVCMERSLDMLVGMLGILQAGGAYVPLDPDYPDERLAYILEDSQATLVLTQEKLLGKLTTFDLHDARCIALDKQWQEINSVVAELKNNHVSLRHEVTAQHLAYIIYTSGSTGKPKGVAIEHHSPVTLIHWAMGVYTSEELAGVLASTSICFDLSVFELFVTLSSGGKIILVPNALALPDLSASIKDTITLINTVPSAIEELLRLSAIPDSVKIINLAGEPLLSTLVDKIYTQCSVQKVFDLYGPSEDTTYSTFILREKNGPQTIGRPIANTQVYMLDRFNNVCPVGVPGELHIAGDGLARGYLNRPELTDEKFVPNPFNSGTRMYKTGDLARWLENGTIEYMGRIDTQIKIRGFRIETGEIEARLNQHQDIKEAVVVAQGEKSRKQLIAFYVANATTADQISKIASEELRAHLQRVLPEYMVPAAFVSLEAIPLTQNGKTNRRALESMDVSFESSHSYQAPRNHLEKQLTYIWAQVLNIGPEKIGVNDNFFELGGHSLLATQLISIIRNQLQVDISQRILFEKSSISQLSQIISCAEKSKMPSLLPVPRDNLTKLPLSFVQERLWFIDKLATNAGYVVPKAISIKGELNINQLEKALNLIVSRHESLRTIFPNRDGRGHQLILAQLDFTLQRVDLSHHKSRKKRNEKAKQLCQDDTVTPFDLTHGPLIRGMVIKLAKNEHILMLNKHHIISDDWSMGVMLKELSLILDAFSQKKNPDLPALPIQYLDYSIWQRQWFQEGGALKEQLAYWQQKLAGVPEGVDLATDFPRPGVQTFDGASQTFILDKVLTENLKNIADKHNCTLYMTLLAAFKVLLHRYTGQEDICVGGAIANRQFSETEKLIGMFVNTLALRSSLAGEDTFSTVLGKVKTTCLEAYEHQDTPFEKIVDLVQPQRNIAINPLFQIMVILQNVPMDAMFDENIQPYALGRNTSKFDITVEFTESSEGLDGIIEFNTALFKPQTIERMVGHFTNLCRAITSAPNIAINNIPYISDSETQQLVTGFNNTQANYPDDKCIHHFFIEQVAINPDKTAIRFEDQTLSYQQLYKKSRDLALYLQASGIGPDSPVGLCVERSLDMMVGILGILQAGGAYVPLDPHYPDERLAYMLENSQAGVVLTQNQFSAKLGTLVSARTKIITLDQQWPEIDACIVALKNKNVELVQQVKPHNLAYVIYTSGSTGQPKGVMVEHKALVNRIWWMQKCYRLDEHDIVLQKTPYSFDVSVWEFVWPMMTGSEVVFAIPDGHKDVEYLENIINTTKITTLHFVPSMLNNFLDNAKVTCPSIRQVFCSGEALAKKSVDIYRARFPNALLHNLYGPTEAAIDVTAIDCSQLDYTFVPIGAPIDNIQIYILDQNNNPQPIGVPGELHIAGDGLARGYLNRPELTREKFVPNPFIPGTRMYKSGDLARWLEDGNIEYLGRIDTQVKIRGFRIEMGEIEAQLNYCPDISDSAVVVQGQDVNKQLIAFYLAKGTTKGNLVSLDDKALREHLLQVLPSYMIPVAFISLEFIPLTSNGKVDRNGLARRHVTLHSNQLYLPPRNELEKQLADIWASVLNLRSEEIGLDDNFFAIGGNSISVVALSTHIEKILACKFLPVTLFKHSTIRSIGEHLHQQNPHKDTELVSKKIVVSKQIDADVKRETFLSDYPDYYQDSLAIVGISCHFPEADDQWQFWENLSQRKESVRHLSIEEARQHNIPEAILNHPDYVPTKAWMEGKEFFDPEFFKISSGNASLMDPQLRQLLLHSWKAVEDAGYVCEDIQKTSVFMSASNNFYQSLSSKISSQAQVMENSDEFMSWLFAQGGTIPTMISYQLGLKGPSVFVHSNCSSSLTGLYSAYQSLQSKDVDYALVGAATLSASMNLGYIHQSGLNLSSDGHCKTFDAKADGMVEGEGVSVILLRRAVDAIAAGDNIYCLLRGISINNDGSDKAGFYAPSVRGQSSVIQQVLNKTGINPESIDYIEAHGTGTALGDPIELMALSEAYQEYTDKKQFCGVGSVKPNIGHLDTAAGLVGCIKLALSLHNKKFPALINYQSPNPQIDFGNSPFYVLDQEKTWTNNQNPKRAALSSFGIGGTNTHAIFEEYKINSSLDIHSNNMPDTQYLIPLSAKRDVLLREYANNLLAFLDARKQQNINLSELAHTLQTGRKAMEHRVIFVVHNTTELMQELSCFIEGNKTSNYFYANINTDKKSVELLEQDDDFQELIQHWIAKDKVKKLAELWVNGTGFDWTLLYAGARPRRMSLPTYPFAKESYWIQNSTEQLLSTPAAAVLHPLLHTNTSDLSLQSYTSIFSGAEFFLADHVINGQKILPAVAYLEMARAAVIQATPFQRNLAVLELRNVVFSKPIVVETSKKITIVLFVNDDEQIEFEIYSTDTLADDVQEILHCQGRAVYTDNQTAVTIDTQQLKKQMQLGAVDIVELYNAFTNLGTDFGPAYQGVTAIHQGDQQLLAQLSLPLAVKNTQSQYQLHPSLMDGALQACTVLIAGLNQLPSRTTLPFSLESLQVIAQCTTSMFAWVRYSAGAKPTDKFIKLDVDLLDSEGNLCVQIKGYAARVFAADAHTSNAAKLFATPVWKPILIDKSINAKNIEYNSAVPVHRHILLCDISDANATANQLETLIPGSQCLAMQSTHRNIADRYTDLAKLCFEKIQTIIKSKPHSTVLVQIIIGDSHESSLYIGLSGLLETATLENPNVVGQMILVDANINLGQLQQCLLENQTQLQDKVIHYAQDNRLVRSWQEITVTQGAPKIAFKDQGVYLITGGLGGLGVLFTEEILKQTTSAKIILTGRSLLSTDNSAEKKAILDKVTRLGSRIEYRQLDIGNLEQVNALISSIKNEYKQLNGIIHSAGMVADNFILKKSTTEFSQVLAPKVIGTYNLDQASKDLDLDFLVLFSSESALGSLGQSDYAAANGFMDQFARYRNQLVADGQRQGRTLAINWSLWQEGGMGIDQASQDILLETIGMRPMQTATGLQAFHECLEMQHDQVLVMEGNFPLMHARLFGRQEQETHQPIHVEAHVQTASVEKVSMPLKNSAETSIVSLIESTQDYLRKQFAELFKLPSHQIDPQAPLENYGIDSILAINLTNKMERTFGSLSKTLLFEYQTISELTEYFIGSFPEKLASLFFTSVSKNAVANADNSVQANDKNSSGVALSVNTQLESVPENSSRMISARRFNNKRSVVGKNPSITTTAQVPANRFSTNADPIAIIGLSGRYPESINVQEFWYNLRDGKDCIIEIPKERWDWRDYYTEDREKDGHHYSKWGGFIAGVDEFDPKFFNISPREAEILDPQERLFLQQAWMAVEDAGYTRSGLQMPHEQNLPGQVGVYVGVMYGEYQLLGAEASMSGKRMGFASSLADIANRVSYVLNLHGPSLTLDTMCSSSLTAIHLACQDLKQGRTDLAIAGGVNISIHPNKYLILSSGQYISSTGHCHSFGEGGDGYIPGEGVGAVILKRLTEAQRDGDHIYGVIKGSALTHGGKTNGYTVPNPQAQASAVSQALAEANINPRHISYIEAHGTGTKLGDPIEIAALNKAFYQHAKEKDVGFCAIGSAKSNIGHCEPAAGIAGLTKVLLQMKHQQIAPSLHATTLNPHIDFDNSPFVVNQKLRTWDQPLVEGQLRPRIAGISSFGAGGSNAHIIVEEYPAVNAQVYTSLPVIANQNAIVIIPLSARTVGQLQQKANDLLTFIEAHAQENPQVIPPLVLENIAYTLQVGREAMEERLAFIVNSIDQLAEKLRAYIDGNKMVEDVYQGQVKANKKDMLNISQDDDMKEAIDKWIGRKKLPKLVDLWVRGLELDWNKLYDDVKPQRISLPAYPFAKERYWIDVADTNQHRKLNTIRPSMLHSLLHANTSNLSQQSYSTHFDGDENYFINPHNGPRILPAGVYLEMARVAIEQASTHRQESSILEFHNTVWGQSFVVAEPATLSIALLSKESGVYGEDQIDFEFYSQDPAANNEAQDIVHCQGHAVFSKQPAPAKLDIAKIKSGLALADSSVVNSDSTRQGISALYLGTQQLLAEINLSATNLSGASDYILHPDMMDCALGLIKNLSQIPHQASLPFALNSIRIVFSCTREMLAWVRCSESGSPQNNTVNVDIDLCDLHGNVCVQLRGIHYQQEALKLLEPVSTTSQPLPAHASSVNAFGHDFEQSSAAPHKPKHIPLAPLASPPAVKNISPNEPGQDKIALVAVSKPNSITLETPRTLILEKAQTLPKAVISLSDAATEFLPGEFTPSALNLYDEGEGIFSIQLNTTMMSTALIDQLLQALDKVQQASVLKVLIIRGSEQGFLSGGREQFNDAVEQQLYNAIVSFSHPIIACMRGDAIGAGFLLASLCDFMVCSQESYYAYRSEQEEFYLSAIEDRLFKVRFGEILAHDFLYLSPMSTGKQLQEKGWVCPILASELVDTYARNLATILSKKQQQSLGLLKQHLVRHLRTVVNTLAPIDESQWINTHAASGESDPIITSSQHFSAEIHAEKILLIKIATIEQPEEMQVLIKDLNDIFSVVNRFTQYSSVVITSEHPEFFADALLDASASTLIDFQNLFLNIRVPVIAALPASAQGYAWTITQFCDACVYNKTGIYSANALRANAEAAKLAAMIFAHRFGNNVSKEILFTTESYSGVDLQARQPGLRVVDADQVVTVALQLAESLIKLPFGRLISWKQQMVLSIQEKIDQLPAWLETNNESANQSLHTAELIALKSSVISATADENGVLIVKMEDRQAKNMHSDAILNGLIEVFAHIEQASNYKVVVLTGYDNYFSTGGTKEDLLAIQKGDAKFTDVKIYHLAMACKLPVVAAMQGHAIGAGWALGMFADFTLFSEKSKYLSPYMNFGFTPGAGATFIFPEKIGHDLTVETLLTAQETSGSELKTRGLLIPVLPGKDLVATAMILAKKIAQHPRNYLIALKHQMTHHLHKPLEESYALELAMHELTLVGQANALEQIHTNFLDGDQRSGKVALASNDIGRVSSAALAQNPGIENSSSVTESQASVTSTLKKLLAQELHMEESEIDEDMQFVDLGLDSIYGVTWVRKINEKYQLSIEAIKVYSYPTLTEFSQFVKDEADKLGHHVNIGETNKAVTVAELPVKVSVPSALPPTNHAPSATNENLPVVIATLKRLLAQELHMEENEIDEEAQFVDLGLDSIYGVTWVRKINEKYLLSIEAIKVYSYPTLAEFSQYVKEEAEKQGTVVNVTPSSQQPAPVAAIVHTTPASQPAHVALATTSSGETLSSVIATLKQLLAQELHMELSEIDEDAQFVDLGLDSIYGVTWVRKINERYTLSIEAIKVYSYPTLAEFSQFVKDEVEKQGGVVQPVLHPVAQQSVSVSPNVSIAPQNNVQVKTVIVPTATYAVKTLNSWRKKSATRSAHDAAHSQSHPIAIVGMAGQFPQSNNLDKFWQNIAQGKNCISEVTDDRWDVERYFQEGKPATRKTNSKWMGMIDEYDHFDPLFFNISPIEAESIDPQQRIFLQACWHTIENAGYNAQSLSGSKCGVFVGCSTSDYNQLSQEQQFSAQGFTGSAISILAARISYFLNLRGPCLTIDTACSSSLVAIANGCDSLNSGSSDLVLAGGVYVMSGPYMHVKTAQSGMLSTDGRCFTFDQRANGFVPGEGVGVVMLKRLADARRDQDIIQGVIQGWGVNQDGKTNGITAPNAESQMRLQQEVYDKYRIDPENIQLIEAHGTGTKLGDPIEIEGLKSAFKKYTQQKDYCALGSVKSNIGHCLAAAGIAGVIKVVLALKHKQLPPSINFERLNEHINLKDSPFYINDQLQDWNIANNAQRQAAISSFGFSGTNAHMVIAEYQPPVEITTAAPVITQNSKILIPLSARTREQLEQKAQDLLAFIHQQHQFINLTDMAYTLQVGREAMEERLGFMVSSVEQLTKKLEAYLESPHSSIDGVYQGQVTLNKEGMRIVSQNNDVKLTLIEKWTASNDLEKLLDLWVKGLDLDWNKLYGQTKPRRIVLPGYPFAKERYWIEEEKSVLQLANTSVATPAVIHPLLHINSSDLFQQSYSSTFTGQEFFLKDHQIKTGDHINQKILPGVAYLEMVRAAVQKAMPTSQQSTILELRNTAWVQPVVVNSKKQINIALFASEVNSLQGNNNQHQHIDFEIYSHAENAGDHDNFRTDAMTQPEEIIHCQGQAIFTHLATPIRLDIEQLRSKMHNGDLEKSAIYSAFIKIGLFYGPAHQGISTIYLGDNQLLAKLDLPADVVANHTDFVLHPSLMDSALQASIGLSPDLNEPGKPSIPFALETLRVIAPCTPQMFAWVRYSSGSKPDDKVTKLNIDMCDSEGNICIQMQGFSTRVVEGTIGSFQQKATNNTTYDHFHDLNNNEFFDDDYYQKIIDRVVDNEISADDAVELG